MAPSPDAGRPPQRSPPSSHLQPPHHLVLSLILVVGDISGHRIPVNHHATTTHHIRHTHVTISINIITSTTRRVTSRPPPSTSPRTSPPPPISIRSDLSPPTATETPPSAAANHGTAATAQLTAEEIVARERERKARTNLLMALPEDHLAKFHKMTDEKETWDAIKSRFGGNDESKKM
ncbi:hypothetical protein Tco_1016841 [Tanacetum coccineum]|uniref:Xylulose kinase-1 n=1 Tax=Tanacetum coccineum TaxID=301880 RepID=A0ABQ5FPS9_9ASTR